MNQITTAIRAFVRDEEGSQVVEYALIIALVSIVLAIALGTGGLDDSFTSLITRATSCFTNTTGTC